MRVSIIYYLHIWPVRLLSMCRLVRPIILYAFLVPLLQILVSLFSVAFRIE